MVVGDRRNRDEAELMRLAASLERASEHPLAAAVIRSAEERGLEIPKAERFSIRLPGKGVTGTVDGQAVAVGNARAA